MPKKMALETESSSLESSVISIGEVDSDPSDIMTAMMDNSSSEEYLDAGQWKISFDDVTITEVVQLSGDEDVYRLVNYYGL